MSLVRIISLGFLIFAHLYKYNCKFVFKVFCNLSTQSKCSDSFCTCGRESVLWPRSLTTVSEELEVEDPISFTINPKVKHRKNNEDVLLVTPLATQLT